MGKRNPLSEKAAEMYKKGIPLVDIARELDVPAGTIRRWKSTQDWDKKNQESESERSGKKGERSGNKSERSHNVSWVEIENEYITDISKKPCSLDTLARKYDIPIDTIKDRCAKHNWVEKRSEYTLSILQNVKEKTADEDTERIVRLLRIADMAADKAEKALEELNSIVVKNKKKTRIVEYKDQTAIGKPTKEVIEENEDIATINGPIDRLGLMQVTSALKHIKDIYAMPTEMDDKKYKTEINKKRVNENDNTGEELLKNIKSIEELIMNPVNDRNIEDLEG